MAKTKIVQSIVFICVLIGCSSGVKEPSSTTVDPAIVKLQKQVDELRNATTLPLVTNPPKVAPTIDREDRSNTGYTNGDQHECRHTIYYSDGTQESEKYWVISRPAPNRWDC